MLRKSKNVIRLIGSVLCLICMGILTAACDDQQPTDADETGESTTLEGSTNSIFKPYKTQPKLMDAVDFDGSADEQLQSALKIIGSKEWTPVKNGQIPAKLRTRMDAALTSNKAKDAGFQFVGIVTNKGHYVVEMDAAEVEGLSDGLGEMVAEGGTTAPAGWSDGVDNRVQRTGSNIPIQQGLVAGVGQCSGALIGRRIVRTAAHCVIAHNSSNGSPVATATYYARRDEGSWYLSASTNFYIYGGAYRPNNCAYRTSSDYWNGYRNNFNACTWADWAFLILPSNWHGSNYIAWYGYRGLGSGETGLDLESGGYPGCDDTRTSEGSLIEDPAGCWDDNQGFYRDISSRCEIGSFTAGTSKFKVGCDISGGNSGGPVIERGTGYLIGHVQWQDCGTCNSSTHYPNHALGHDDWLFNYQNSLRQSYP